MLKALQRFIILRWVFLESELQCATAKQAFSLMLPSFISRNSVHAYLEASPIGHHVIYFQINVP